MGIVLFSQSFCFHSCVNDGSLVFIETKENSLLKLSELWEENENGSELYWDLEGVVQPNRIYYLYSRKRNLGSNVHAPKRIFWKNCGQATPFLAGLAVAAAALAGRYGIQAWHAFKTRPPKPRKFYEGGFQPKMTKREAALILGVRESATPDKVKEAHRKVMVANHPDAGGSHYLASKINEAKDVMLGKTKGSGSAF
ncbi:hypothetical protein CDL15_Pgr026006 [Punica granatum]|uniref:J domain-containing protein n=1 Tax=Punica granatum TaxID=22663 RepID=A0A218WBY5_PUNGR|nr:hypothetical protein CDL15_Pgr026006 [Punica granatum]